MEYNMPSGRRLDKVLRPWQRQKYNLVPDQEGKPSADATSDTSDDAIINTADRPGFVKRFWIVFSISILLGLIVVASATFIAYKLAVNKALTKPTVNQCGSTSAEARKLGCIFETTLSLWVPPDCYDFELETIYLQQEGLKYYRDVNLTEEVSLREVKTGEAVGWFVPWDHHVRHCSFAFRKFHRAAAFGKKIDGYVLQYAHTEHCLKMMTEPEEWRSNITQFDMSMFPYCGKEGGYNVNSKHRGTWT